MKIIRKINLLRKEIAAIKARRRTIGFVPTMGALHKGHLSLIRKARKDNDLAIVSIFVNPAQFGSNEDFRKYPRTFKQDKALCCKAGVDFIFAPEDKDMYPVGYKTYVEVRGLGGVLCGRFRKNHFSGVATIVAKLFNLIQPDIAYFGQKDAQQASIIKKMVYDLNIPVRIEVMPTVRDRDGLALSSRNTYLKSQERKDASVLYQALKLARRLIKDGATDSRAIIRKMSGLIESKKSAKVQYISIVDVHDLSPLDKVKGSVLIALAVWIGDTRLIDNILVNVK